MAVIGNIDGIPLFTTVQEALVWGQANGLSGYHVHTLQGVTGYMGGANHSQARNPTSIPPPTFASPSPIAINYNARTAAASSPSPSLSTGSSNSGY
jgi:hypothetical protein